MKPPNRLVFTHYYGTSLNRAKSACFLVGEAASIIVNASLTPFYFSCPTAVSLSVSSSFLIFCNSPSNSSVQSGGDLSSLLDAALRILIYLATLVVLFLLTAPGIVSLPIFHFNKISRSFFVIGDGSSIMMASTCFSSQSQVITS